MNKKEDRTRFSRMMASCASIYSREIDIDAIRIFWDALCAYDVDSVGRAFSNHIKRSKFFPTPAEIIELIPGSEHKLHIGADEAWSIVLESFDESKTVVLTDEILAAKNISQCIWDDGDKIGARMAFKSAYDRLSKSSSSVNWKVSIGYDKEDRVRAISNAVRIGRITPEQGRKYLPDMCDPGPIAGLLTGKATELPENDENLKKRWHELKNAISEGVKKLEQKEIEKNQAEIDRQEEFTRKKQEAIEYCDLDKVSGDDL